MDSFVATLIGIGLLCALILGRAILIDVLSASPRPPPTSIPSDGSLYPETPTLLRRMLDYLRPKAPPAPTCDRHISDEHMHLPLLAYLYCPRCSNRHIDTGTWAVKKHHTHLCEHCGFRFRVEPYCIDAAGNIGVFKGGPYRGQS